MAAIDYTSLLDIHAVADRLGVNVRWVRRQIASRRIPFYKLGGVLRFDIEEIGSRASRRLRRCSMPTLHGSSAMLMAASSARRSGRSHRSDGRFSDPLGRAARKRETGVQSGHPS